MTLLRGHIKLEITCVWLATAISAYILGRSCAYFGILADFSTFNFEDSGTTCSRNPLVYVLNPIKKEYMKSKNKFYSIIYVALIAFTSNAQDKIREYVPADKLIYSQIESMDKLFFDAYNSCDLKTQESIYADNIEFFHDKAGLINSKSEIIQGTKNNICGKVTRYLIPGSIEVYPINNYGAVEIGFHRFYNNQEPDAESKPSKFIIVWKKENENWKITKVVSLH